MRRRPSAGLVAYSGCRKPHIPDLRPQMPVADLVTLAQVLACSRIDEQQDVQTLHEDVLTGLMSSLKIR
jgi:hypothetical protein